MAADVKITLKQRLDIRAKAFLANDELIKDEHLTTAVTEAITLAGAKTSLPVLTDIAFYRFLLLAETNFNDENQRKVYELALKQINKANDNESSAITTPKVKPATNRYL